MESMESNFNTNTIMDLTTNTKFTNTKFTNTRQIINLIPRNSVYRRHSSLAEAWMTGSESDDDDDENQKEENDEDEKKPKSSKKDDSDDSQALTCVKLIFGDSITTTLLYWTFCGCCDACFSQIFGCCRGCLVTIATSMIICCTCCCCSCFLCWFAWFGFPWFYEQCYTVDDAEGGGLWNLIKDCPLTGFIWLIPYTLGKAMEKTIGLLCFCDWEPCAYALKDGFWFVAESIVGAVKLLWLNFNLGNLKRWGYQLWQWCRMVFVSVLNMVGRTVETAEKDNFDDASIEKR